MLSHIVTIHHLACTTIHQIGVAQIRSSLPPPLKSRQFSQLIRRLSLLLPIERSFFTCCTHGRRSGGGGGWVITIPWIALCAPRWNWRYFAQLLELHSRNLAGNSCKSVLRSARPGRRFVQSAGISAEEKMVERKGREEKERHHQVVVVVFRRGTQRRILPFMPMVIIVCLVLFPFLSYHSPGSDRAAGRSSITHTDHKNLTPSVTPTLIYHTQSSAFGRGLD